MIEIRLYRKDVLKEKQKRKKQEGTGRKKGIHKLTRRWGEAKGKQGKINVIEAKKRFSPKISLFLELSSIFDILNQCLLSPYHDLYSLIIIYFSLFYLFLWRIYLFSWLWPYFADNSQNHIINSDLSLSNYVQIFPSMTNDSETFIMLYIVRSFITFDFV